MVDELNLALVDSNNNPKTVVASKKDLTTFEYTPAKNCSDGYCGLWTGQPSTRYASSTGIWYYNFQAAHAHDAAPSSDEPASICPLGWQLPYNYSQNSNQSYGGLTNAYEITFSGANTDSSEAGLAIQKSPLDFNIKGYFSGGNDYTSGSLGNPYWNTGSSNIFEWRNDYVYPQYTSRVHTYYTWQGYVIRCLAVR